MPPTKPPDKSIECHRRNITYLNTCLLCKETGKRTQYVGESSRSLRERHGEHVDDATTKKEDSHMWVHAHDEHEGQMKYQIQPLKTHTSSMVTQISETVKNPKKMMI